MFIVRKTTGYRTLRRGKVAGASSALLVSLVLLLAAVIAADIFWYNYLLA